MYVYAVFSKNAGDDPLWCELFLVKLEWDSLSVWGADRKDVFTAKLNLCKMCEEKIW